MPLKFHVAGNISTGSNHDLRFVLGNAIVITLWSLDCGICNFMQLPSFPWWLWDESIERCSLKANYGALRDSLESYFMLNKRTNSWITPGASDLLALEADSTQSTDPSLLLWIMRGNNFKWNLISLPVPLLTTIWISRSGYILTEALEEECIRFLCNVIEAVWAIPIAVMIAFPAFQ